MSALRYHSKPSTNNTKTNEPATKPSHAGANGAKESLADKKSKPAKPKSNSATDPRTGAPDNNKQPSHHKTSTKPTNRAKSGPPSQSRSATDTTTTKEQMTYVHQFDNSKSGPVNEQKSEGQSMVLQPRYRATLKSYPTSHTTQPGQTTGFPNFNLANLPISNLNIPQIAQFHNQTALQGNPPSKGYVKVQVSKKITTSQPSK
ncbi:hypothetical protein PTTG_01183 [Puccinia triticina 1-1 BBBD Race 1]|uniref:Uncharacterized protein n=1 Tax=Puccinia triticina (isolate 1-1 / race 1 (BBBD)) TaxID=630390 RepID=A0A180GZE6_PUCT1|nr:hypothetical protein PTTG_01183 [Puccinia triticina 1-1 BBBD Race 1]